MSSFCPVSNHDRCLLQFSDVDTGQLTFSIFTCEKYSNKRESKVRFAPVWRFWRAQTLLRQPQSTASAIRELLTNSICLAKVAADDIVRIAALAQLQLQEINLNLIVLDKEPVLHHLHTRNKATQSCNTEQSSKVHSSKYCQPFRVLRAKP